MKRNYQNDSSLEHKLAEAIRSLERRVAYIEQLLSSKNTPTTIVLTPQPPIPKGN